MGGMQTDSDYFIFIHNHNLCDYERKFKIQEVEWNAQSAEREYIFICTLWACTYNVFFLYTINLDIIKYTS